MRSNADLFALNELGDEVGEPLAYLCGLDEYAKGRDCSTTQEVGCNMDRIYVGSFFLEFNGGLDYLRQYEACFFSGQSLRNWAGKGRTTIGDAI